ncbi:MAG: hypothetical protein VX712_01190 [Bacteroidota bacterium]|uniref:Uncharacterized protein n=1 Tax=Christiangramia flava JLT2011 TaxID=1229726 RepID=A0A1L7I9T2_9FLAO|nr:hypothetical protein [Christiangramia flava]APU69862.1 hypothetical protein GRFL_3138 [Christiangramia flava JLT2011]MEE2770800.1 hypothetical protein [Bacteroidota bacterium]OSS37822.1 hypothetical protein C723_3291 [Christiangramia flava JLT2011]
MEEKTSGKTVAIVAYLTIVGTIIAYFMNLDGKDPLGSFHIRQAFGVHILFYILAALLGFFDSGSIVIAFYVFFFVLWLFGIVHALKGEERPIPVIGPLFQKWFSTIS